MCVGQGLPCGSQRPALCVQLEYLTRLATCTARPGPENGFFGYVVEPMNLIDLMCELPPLA